MEYGNDVVVDSHTRSLPSSSGSDGTREISHERPSIAAAYCPSQNAIDSQLQLMGGINSSDGTVVSLHVLFYSNAFVGPMPVNSQTLDPVLMSFRAEFGLTMGRSQNLLPQSNHSSSSQSFAFSESNPLESLQRSIPSDNVIDGRFGLSENAHTCGDTSQASNAGLPYPPAWTGSGAQPEGFNALFGSRPQFTASLSIPPYMNAQPHVIPPDLPTTYDLRGNGHPGSHPTPHSESNETMANFGSNWNSSIPSEETLLDILPHDLEAWRLVFDDPRMMFPSDVPGRH